MKKIYWLLSLIFSIFLAACSQKSQVAEQAEVSPMPKETADSANVSRSAKSADMSQSNQSVRSGERLGTSWGDELSSDVKEVYLKRLSSNPIAETQVRYASKQFQGKSINNIALNAGKITFSIVDDNKRVLPLYRDGQSYYLSANQGQSYQLLYENSSDQTFEIVASVDGLDVIDGSRASRKNSGYVLRPHDRLYIEGFRKSNSAVASFTFSKPRDAYAAHSLSGSINNTGVIGTVIYELRAPKSKTVKTDTGGYAPAPNAFPADR